MFIHKATQTKMKKISFKKLVTTRKPLAVTVLAVAAVLAIGFTAIPKVTADSYDEKIRALQQENKAKKYALSALQVEASSYQDAIAQLQAQISGVQAEINANVAKQKELQGKIDESQRELDEQKRILGENIRVMYVEDQMTTIEMLATSKNLSEFVDKEEYRTAVKNKIQESMKRIAVLQNQLKEQKTEAERLLVQQKAQQNQLAYSRAEQSRLLNLNQSQQNEYNAQMSANSAKIAELKEQQAIENTRLFGGGGGTVGGGGYPWGYAKCVHTGRVEGSCPNYDWGINGQIWNYQNGGYGYRNCTDWVAWRAQAPGGLGNAKQWDDRAAAMGYTVSDTPRKGAAAVSNSGTYGHVMYVESVNSDGSIIISDYNRAGTGLYSVTTLSASKAASLVYVYF